MFGDIRVLPDLVANQIAAGEVIERPVAVVKELVENSLDAGATRIEVEFRNGGKSYIRVEDNGKGMAPDEALLCLERHATSKIREAADLDSIQSFGFRGEALPSIASVSRFTLQTRGQDREHGTEVRINEGKLLDKKDCGMPVGTKIEVAHLFNSVPARRKFLKTDATESAHIAYTTRLFAVAHPNIAFSLIENGRTLFRSPACNALPGRIAEIWGKGLADNLLPVDAVDPKSGLRLGGLTAKPGVGRATRRELVTLVNNRPVDNRTLGFAVLDAYHGRIQKGRYPPAFLFLQIDPAQVDVNVHPAKREVRFRDESTVRRFILESVEKAIAPALPLEPMQKLAPSDTPQGKERPPLPDLSTLPSSHPSLPRPLPKEVPASTDAVTSQRTTSTPPLPKKTSSATESSAAHKPISASAPIITGWKLLARFQMRYALFQTPEGLVMLQLQHAIQRVRYEQIEDDFSQGSAASQPLLLPIPIDMEPVAAEQLAKQTELLQANGFVVEPFGTNFFRIESIPAWLPDAEAENFIRDLIDQIRQRGDRQGEKTLHRETLKQLACKYVSRDALPQSDEAVEVLAAQLLNCRVPHTAPSGKPTLTEISWSDWSKRFQE
jgi:DNA mismatch repair protein MutL